MRVALLALAVVVTLAGCGIFGGGVCTAVFVSGVNVTVVDDNGDPVGGATATLTEGTYTEQMDELGTGSFAGAGERTGTYTLTVEAEGFETVTIENIVVLDGGCHVVAVSREVTLVAS